jgi:histidinol-phosphate aminotransferase
VPMRLNPVLEKLTPYHAGPPLDDIRRRYQLERVSQLSANESPWGPFPEVVEAMKAALEGLNRYPDGACSELRGLLAERLGVSEDRLTFGNGSCELLMLLGEVFLGPGRHAVLPHPSFVMYRAIALARGAGFARVDLPGLDYDLEAMLAAVREETALLIICNPNNPTGSHIEEGELRAFLRRVPNDVVVVLDEAYGEFVTPDKQVDSVRLLDEFSNLIVLRTFSKIFGLAGLRVGYGLAEPQAVRALDKVRQPFNVDSLAQVAAAAALRLPERMEERRRMVAEERARIEARLDSFGVAYHPSEANFILADVTRLGIPGPEVAQALLEKGVLTRSGYAMECPGWIRVTIGEAAENDMFLEALAELRGSHEASPPHRVDDLSAEALSPES